MASDPLLDIALGSDVVGAESVIPHLDVPAIEAANGGDDMALAAAQESGRNAIRPPDGNVAGFNYYSEDFTVTEAVSGFIGLFAACAATVALGFQVKKRFRY